MASIIISDVSTAKGFWRFAGSTCELRIAANQSFLNSEGQLVPRGLVSQPASCLVIKTCTVNADKSVSIPEVELFITDDSIDLPTATYTAALYPRRSSQRQMWPDEVVASGFALYTYLGEDVGNEGVTTWARVVLANLGAPLINPPATWPTYRMMVDYINTLEPAQKATSVIYGVGRLNIPADDSSDPVMLGANDPRLDPASPTNSGVVKISVAADDPDNPIAVGVNDYASLTNHGIIRLSKTPTSPSDPVAVGSNETPWTNLVSGNISVIGNVSFDADSDGNGAGEVVFRTKAGLTRGRVANSGIWAVGGSHAPDAAAALDVSSVTGVLGSPVRGFLPPKGTTTQRNAISSPPQGLHFENTTLNTYDRYNGSSWVSLLSSSQPFFTLTASNSAGQTFTQIDQNPPNTPFPAYAGTVETITNVLSSNQFGHVVRLTAGLDLVANLPAGQLVGYKVPLLTEVRTTAGLAGDFTVTAVNHVGEVNTGWLGPMAVFELDGNQGAVASPSTAIASPFTNGHSTMAVIVSGGLYQINTGMRFLATTASNKFIRPLEIFSDSYTFRAIEIGKAGGTNSSLGAELAIKHIGSRSAILIESDSTTTGNAFNVLDSAGSSSLASLSITGEYLSTVGYKTTGTASKFYVVNGEGFELWKDSTPSTAWDMGNRVPGGSVTDDIIFSYFGGASWAEAARLTGASVLKIATGGSIQIAGTQVLGARQTGWTTNPTGTLTRTTFDSTTIALPDLAARVAALIVDLRAQGEIGA